MHRITLLLIFALSLYGSSFAQPASGQPFVLGTIERLRSVELGEERTLNIYLPAGYDPASDKTYPVIYLLDGGQGEDFVHICGVVQFLTEIVDTLPKAIVVGIANEDRKRDFTFTRSKGFFGEELPTSGGSAKFIAFVEKELQPYIKSRYKVSDSRTLIGQSLGGLLATEILIRKPDLFDKYLIVSPSLWWHDGSLLTEAQEVNKTPVTVCLAMGTEGDRMEAGAKKLLGKLAASGKGEMTVSYLSLPDETHRTVLHGAAQKGLQILFGE